MFVTIFTWITAAVFLLGSVINATGAKGVKEEFDHWGLPQWMRYLAAAMELTTAVLLVVPGTALLGCLVGACVMAGAIATLLKHKEYKHAIAPVTLLAALGVVAWLN